MQTGIPMRRAEYTACLDTLEKAAKGKKPSLFMLYHTYLSTSPDKLTGVLYERMKHRTGLSFGNMWTLIKGLRYTIR